MRKFSLFLFILLSIYSKSFAQSVTCDVLLAFIKQEGFYSSSISSYTLNSSWLYKVTAYTYDYKTYVVAEIKTNEYSYNTTTYVFCGIPTRNWSNFQHGSYGDSDSYGERFHKYIIDYQCDCS